MFPQSTSNQTMIPKAYNCKALEGNWYEDRCMSNYNEENLKKFSLLNQNAWQYKTTYSDVGNFNSKYPPLKDYYYKSNENYINFQDKRNDMFISTYKNSYNSMYRESFRDIPSKKGYYDDKLDKLETYRNDWLKKPQSFKTTYNEDMMKTFLTKK